MRDGATKSFEQAFNAQTVVDDTAQIIVATGLTQGANDTQQLVPVLKRGVLKPGTSADGSLMLRSSWLLSLGRSTRAVS